MLLNWVLTKWSLCHTVHLIPEHDRDLFILFHFFFFLSIRFSRAWPPNGYVVFTLLQVIEMKRREINLIKKAWQIMPCLLVVIYWLAGMCFIYYFVIVFSLTFYLYSQFFIWWHFHVSKHTSYRNASLTDSLHSSVVTRSDVDVSCRHTICNYMSVILET